MENENYELDELRDSIRDLDEIAYSRHRALRKICESLDLSMDALGDDQSSPVVICEEIRRVRVLAGNPSPDDYSHLLSLERQVKDLSGMNHKITARLSELMSRDDFHDFMTSLEPSPRPMSDDESAALTEFLRTR